MSKFKTITFLWIFFLTIFVVFHFLIFSYFTSKVYPITSKTTIGDLARMSYLVNIIQERENKNDLNKIHLSQEQYHNEQIDILTIGDSFSNGNAGGKNSYYQDYISTFYNKSVLNLNAQNVENTSNYIEIIALFANSGYLEKIGAKYVLIESVQREALVRFARNDLNLAIKTDKNLETIFRNSMETYNIEKLHNLKPSIINNLNLNAFIYNIKYYIKGYGKLNSSVYIEKLNKDLFTSKSSSKLAFYHEDIKKLSLETKENIEMISSAVAKGTIQLLPDGQLIALMPDCQTVGGYPKIAHIITTDISKCAQLKPSESIFFSIVSLVEAEKLLEKQNQQIKLLETLIQQHFS